MSGAPTAPKVPMTPPFPASESIDSGSKQVPSKGIPAGQASAARVMRSCSVFCPRLRIVPKASARGGAWASVAERAARASALAGRGGGSNPLVGLLGATYRLAALEPLGALTATARDGNACENAPGPEGGSPRG